MSKTQAVEPARRQPPRQVHVQPSRTDAVCRARVRHDDQRQIVRLLGLTQDTEQVGRPTDLHNAFLETGRQGDRETRETGGRQHSVWPGHLSLSPRLRVLSATNPRCAPAPRAAPSSRAVPPAYPHSPAANLARPQCPDHANVRAICRPPKYHRATESTHAGTRG